jgi:NADPH-dependent 2,4-dienoyl-CoA reductase/sulfur reductase-like enzyme
MRSFLAEQSPQRAVIVGGGYVALEMAEAFVERGLETTMVLRRRRLLGETLDEDMAAPLLAQVEARGVETVVALTEGVVASGGRVRAVRTQGGDVPADLVVVATGVRPRSALARAMGCDLVEPGAIAVDARMRTSVPHVWAAGDCATSWHRLLERPVYAPLALAANRGGRIVGENVAGGDERAPGVLGTVITRFFGTDVARTGLTEVEAEAAGHRAVATTITDSVASGYMPGAGEARFKLVAQRGSGRLFGAQIVGSRGAGKRIDTVVAALHLGATAGALADMDLAYAPPYSPVYDPLLIAARLAQRSARE